VKIVSCLYLQLPVLWFQACAIPSDLYSSKYRLLSRVVNFSFMLLVELDIAFSFIFVLQSVNECNECR